MLLPLTFNFFLKKNSGWSRGQQCCCERGGALCLGTRRPHSSCLGPAAGLYGARVSCQPQGLGQRWFVFPPPLCFPLSLLPSSCLVPLSCRHTHAYCVCVCVCVCARTRTLPRGGRALLKLWVRVQCLLRIGMCIGGHSRCRKWGRSALSCAFSVRMLFVPLPNSKPSAEGRTEHPRVT